MSLASGTRLGPYQLIGTIGAGGMGEVYRAHDSRLGRDVAVKILPEAFAADDDRLRRFEREAQAIAALSHPNILAIFDVGSHVPVATASGAAQAAPIMCMVTELLDGESLRARMDSGRLPVSKAVDCARQIASGLAAAHARGITHRDIKPENVFVTKDGHVKILDFGLTKQASDAISDATRLQSATAAGVVLGTVGYMSPEQVRGEAADARSDIFSFGVVLYELLAGERPFRGDTAVQTMNATLTEDPPELASTGRALPPAFERVVRHCLEKNPEERFQSARDLAFALDALSSSSAPSSSVAAIEPVRPPSPPVADRDRRAGGGRAAAGHRRLDAAGGRRGPQRLPVHAVLVRARRPGPRGLVAGRQGGGLHGPHDVVRAVSGVRPLSGRAGRDPADARPEFRRSCWGGCRTASASCIGEAPPSGRWRPSAASRSRCRCPRTRRH